MSKFLDVFEDVTKKGTKISTDKYLQKGNYPIIDQGKDFISGYCDDATGLFTDVPAIIFGDHTRIIKYVDIPCFLGADGVKLLKAKDKNVDYKFLYYALCNAKIPNTGYNRHYKWLKEIDFPMPEIDIQHKIAENLDKVTSLIEHYNTMLEKLDLLVKSQFVERFGDPEADTCTYETTKLKELSIKISDGVHAKPEYTETGRPFLSVVNINRKKVDFTDCKFVSEEAYQKMVKSTHPEKGDVLYTKVGATYGIPAYVDTDTDFCLYVSVCLIKPKHELINSKFLAIQMDMPFVKHQADRRIKGIGVPDLHLNQISEFDIVCPPRKLQDSFVNFVEQIDKSKLAVKKVLEKAELLKKSLMQEYFG